MNIVSFSGGKDSTAMLLMMLERGEPIDRILYVDTTKEFPAMYRHIEKVQAMCPIKIERLTMDFDYWFKRHVKTRSKHKDHNGYGWPMPLARWCTSEKIKALKRAKPKDCIDYIGIAYDERKRKEKKCYPATARFPLIEWEVTEAQALEYCYSKGLDWEGLYEKFNRVSCWCCPLQRVSCLRTLYNDFPALWAELVEMDKSSRQSFKARCSVAEFTERFDREARK